MNLVITCYCNSLGHFAIVALNSVSEFPLGLDYKQDGYEGGVKGKGKGCGAGGHFLRLVVGGGKV